MTATAGESLAAQDDISTEVLDLTRAQAGLWYAQQLQPDNPIFTIAQYIEVRGAVDPERWRRAWERVVGEIDVLRARFDEGPDGPVQVVEPAKPVTFAVVDLRGEQDPVVAAREWMRAEQAVVMDPAGGALLSIAVLLLRDDLSYCYQRVHHLALDGYGATIVLPRVLAVYEAEGRPRHSSRLTGGTWWPPSVLSARGTLFGRPTR